MKTKSFKIHKEGYYYLVKFIFFALLFDVGVIYLFKNNHLILTILITLSLILIGILYNFFRIPRRMHRHNENHLYSPADGKIVAIEKIKDDTFFNGEANYISIFMSITDVHVNFSPISGTVTYKEHFAGKHMVAFNPKSSDKNERSTIIIENNERKVLVRQVAGFLARRIINKWEKGDKIRQFDELGIIKLGSRVDIITPNNLKINVKIGQQVYANETILAEFI